MGTNPHISVIMPCYNMEKFIASSIQSVCNQTFSHWELLIVDDASTDKTTEIIRKFQEADSRIHFAAKSMHTGIAATRNQAIGMAKGQYLAFLDADDVWHPDKLEKQFDFMKTRNIGFSYSAYNWIDEAGNELGKTIPTTDDLNYNDYLHNTIIGCSTVMVNTNITGLISIPEFRTSEDTATWLNILKKGFLAYAFPEVLVSYRIREKSASSNKIKAAHDLWKVYRQQEKLSLFQTLSCFCSYAYHAIKKRL